MPKTLEEKYNFHKRSWPLVIGLLVSSLPAVQYGPLYYSSLEIDKNTALRQNNGNYEATMTLTSESVSDFSWWVTRLPTACKNITMGNPVIEMATDASPLATLQVATILVAVATRILELATE